MSFTVVIKDNENGKILFASEKTKALVIGVVADEASTDIPATALAGCCSSPADMAIAMGLAMEAIEGIEKQDPTIKMLGPATDAFLACMRSKKIIKEGREDD